MLTKDTLVVEYKYYFEITTRYNTQIRLRVSEELFNATKEELQATFADLHIQMQPLHITKVVMVHNMELSRQQIF